jgi:hypothetical protein
MPDELRARIVTLRPDAEDPRIRAVEECLYQAALEDWRAALAWLRAHPKTADRYAVGPKWRFTWDTDE